MKKLSALALVLIFLSLSVFGAEGSVRAFFPSTRTVGRLPVDSTIGQTAQPDSSDVHDLVSRALASEYSFEWTETFLHPDVRGSLVSLFGTWLSENLPASEPLLSVSHRNSDGSFGLNVRVGDSCMAFIVDGDFIVSMKRLESDK